jgi:hypothetical protein
MGDLTKEAIEAGEVELSRVLKDFDYLMPTDGMAQVLSAALAASPPSPTSREEIRQAIGGHVRDEAVDRIFALFTPPEPAPKLSLATVEVGEWKTTDER